MSYRNPISLSPTPTFGLGWLCEHVRGAVQLPGEAAYECSCSQLPNGTRPHAVVLAADWTDVEAARHYAEANGLDVISTKNAKARDPRVIFVRKPNYA